MKNSEKIKYLLDTESVQVVLSIIASLILTDIVESNTPWALHPSWYEVFVKISIEGLPFAYFYGWEAKHRNFNYSIWMFLVYVYCGAALTTFVFTLGIGLIELIASFLGLNWNLI